ncbi:hypothetical protein K439DRAFT_1622488 [Ramaria rubella]|nr:hypothetical protein K439DRAFT_1622488 [Ramaria rubella]
MAVTSKDQRFHDKSSGLILIQTAMDMKRGTLVLVAVQPHLQRSVAYNERLHESNNGFASIILLVCAIASHWSDNPHVLQPDQASSSNIPISRHSAGWKYFDQAQMQRKSLVSAASPFDLQRSLAAIFLPGSAAPYSSWVIVDIGLRVAQDISAHRNRMSDAPVERDSWKRTFWVRVNLDRVGSAALGRPCAIHDEDFLEVDDEYWETSNPEDAFKQPLDIPSTVAYFNVLQVIRLDHILSVLLQTITQEPSWFCRTQGLGTKHCSIIELDTSLDQWLDTVPNHLRWDLSWDHSDEFFVFFQQSATLYATYYHIQVLVHRPFIPRPGTPPLTYPSLAICTNAARSCSQVLQALCRKCDAGSAPHLMFFAFTSELVLLLNIWGMRKEGLMGDAATPTRDVHMCIRFLKTAETRWDIAGRLYTGFDQRAPMNLGRMPLHPDPTFLQPLASASGSTPPLGNNPMLVICINNFWEVGAPIRNRSGELGVVPGVGASIWRQFHSPGSPGWVLKYSERYSRRSKKTLLGIQSTCGRRCLPNPVLRWHTKPRRSLASTGSILQSTFRASCLAEPAVSRISELGHHRDHSAGCHACFAGIPKYAVPTWIAPETQYEALFAAGLPFGPLPTYKRDPLGRLNQAFDRNIVYSPPLVTLAPIPINEDLQLQRIPSPQLEAKRWHELATTMDYLRMSTRIYSSAGQIGCGLGQDRPVLGSVGTESTEPIVCCGGFCGYGIRYRAKGGTTALLGVQSPPGSSFADCCEKFQGKVSPLL